MVWVLTFPPPDKPWSTNQDRNLNKYERAERIKAWKEATYYAASLANLPRLERIVVQITIPFGQRRRRDPHNYCGTVLKAVADGLVWAGVVDDDDATHLGHREPILTVGGDVETAIWAD